MVYDCFLFFNELELLDIRLHEMSRVVDKFVLVESTVTFTGNQKKLYFENNKSRYSEYLDKIIHVVVSDSPVGNDVWGREHFQRNQISRGLVDASPDDYVIVSDVDEIVRSSSLVSLIKCQDKCPIKFKQDFYYYNVNCRSRNMWQGSVMIQFKDYKSAREVKYGKVSYTEEKGGWHFSYFNDIRYKLMSFSHTEFGGDKYIEEEYINDRIKRSVDLFGRPSEPFEYTDKYLDSLPEYMPYKGIYI